MFAPLVSNHRPLLLSPFRAVLAVCFAVALVAGCEVDRSPVEASHTKPDIRAYVTGEAAKSLDEKGQFPLATAEAPDQIPIISRDRAGELALAYVRTFAPHFQRKWEQEHKGPIHIGLLRVDPRIFYAQSAYEPVPDGYHRFHRRSLVRTTWSS